MKQTNNVILIKICNNITLLDESNRIWAVTEYGNYRYLRNHKSYKKMFSE